MSTLSTTCSSIFSKHESEQDISIMRSLYYNNYLQREARESSIMNMRDSNFASGDANQEQRFEAPQINIQNVEISSISNIPADIINPNKLHRSQSNKKIDKMLLFTRALQTNIKLYQDIKDFFSQEISKNQQNAGTQKKVQMKKDESIQNQSQNQGTLVNQKNETTQQIDKKQIQVKNKQKSLINSSQESNFHVQVEHQQYIKKSYQQKIIQRPPAYLNYLNKQEKKMIMVNNKIKQSGYNNQFQSMAQIQPPTQKLIKQSFNNTSIQKHENNLNEIQQQISEQKQKLLNQLRQYSNVVEFRRKGRVYIFMLIDILGRGSFGVVYLARQLVSGWYCAIKRCFKFKINNSQNELNLIRQFKLGFFLNHPNIVKLYGVFNDKQSIYAIFQLLEQNNLGVQIKYSRTYMNKLDIFRTFSFQLMAALTNLAKYNIIHRDIKPENIFLNFGCIKLGDFGCATIMENKNQIKYTDIGSLAYSPPQMLEKGQYTAKFDVWSLGITLYQMLYGKNPFAPTVLVQRDQVIKKIKKYKQLAYQNLEDEIKSFLLKLICDESQRLLPSKFITNQFYKAQRKKHKLQMQGFNQARQSLIAQKRLHSFSLIFEKGDKICMFLSKRKQLDTKQININNVKIPTYEQQDNKKI